MASAGNPSPDSKRTERGLRHRLSRISFTQSANGSNDANGGSPAADKLDDELLKTAKGFIDELYQQYIVIATKRRCFEHYREKVVLYLAARQKREYVSRHKKEKAEIKRASLELKDAVKDLQRAHREVVEQKDMGFGADGNSNDKPNADTEAFSENILKVLPICPIDKTIDVLSYLNKAVDALDKLYNTYNWGEAYKLRREYYQLDSKRLELRQQSTSEQASAATTRRTAVLYHSDVVKLHRSAKDMKHQEDADYQSRIYRYNLTAKLDRQFEKTERLRRKLEAPADAGVEVITVTPNIQ
ncbi:hypothetical protein ACEPAI_10088 [Sanghuangporus weigelae]